MLSTIARISLMNSDLMKSPDAKYTTATKTGYTQIVFARKTGKEWIFLCSVRHCALDVFNACDTFKTVTSFVSV